MSKTLNQWLEFIFTLHRSRIDLSLQRIESIAQENKLKHFLCPVIMVAGTNGKGSCIRVLESIYSAAGYRVGAYYSPHLYRFNERLRIQEKEVDDVTLIAAFERIEGYRKGRPLSFFEYTTLAVLTILHSIKLDIVLLEVGLGGRLDAVNVVEPDVSIVTSIGLDHIEWLGSNRDMIAYEKSGIYRKAKPAICGDEDPPQRLMTYIQEIGALFFQISRDFSYTINLDSWSWFGKKTQYQTLPIPHLKYQNIASSLMALECLQDCLYVNETHIKQGIEEARLPGRFQTFLRPVKGILDVAHNPDSARWLAAQIKQMSFPAKKIGLIGMLKDKDIAGTINPLIPHIDLWFVAQLDAERAADSQAIMSCLKAFGIENCADFDTVPEALRQAIQACANPEDRLIVFGSFHTVARVQQELSKEVFL